MIQTSNTFARLALVIATVSLLFAERTIADELALVVPGGLESVEGDTLVTIGDENGINIPARLQYLYPASDFESLPNGNRTLAGYSLRLDESWTTGTTVVLQDLEIRVSTTPVDSLSTTYADNVGPDETVVFTGDFSHVLPLGGPPREFATRFTFDPPFNYDPSAGNLLLDLQLGGGFSEAFSLDAQNTETISAVATFGDLNSPTANLSAPLLLVSEFVFVPEPSTALLTSLGFACVLGGWRKKRRKI